MPYKDPKKRKAVATAAGAKWYSKNREEKRLSMLQYHQENRDDILKRIQANNRKKLERKPRVKGSKARPEVPVSAEDVARIFSFNGEDFIKFSPTSLMNWETIKSWATKLAGDTAILQQAPTVPKLGRRKWNFLKSKEGQPHVVVPHRIGLSLDDVRLLVSEFKGYANIPSAESSSAAAIRTQKPVSPPAELDVRFAKEGGRKMRTHYEIERDSQTASKKKQSVLKSGGALICEVCGFDFFRAYGPIGQGFCEVHHLIQLSGLNDKRAFQANELAIVCSNCHRMLHRKQECLTLVQLRDLMKHKITYNE